MKSTKKWGKKSLEINQKLNYMVPPFENSHGSVPAQRHSPTEKVSVDELKLKKGSNENNNKIRKQMNDFKSHMI